MSAFDPKRTSAGFNSGTFRAPARIVTIACPEVRASRAHRRDGRYGATKNLETEGAHAALHQHSRLDCRGIAGAFRSGGGPQVRSRAAAAAGQDPRTAVPEPLAAHARLIPDRRRPTGRHGDRPGAGNGVWGIEFDSGKIM